MLLSHEHFMREAIRLAERAAEEGEIPVGALIVSGNQILGKGYNQTERLGDVTAHAEMLALTAAADKLGSKYLTDCRLYVSLEPCAMCAAALAWSQIPEIYIGAPDSQRGYTRYTPSLLHPRTVVASGILSDECAALLRAFFEARR